MTARSLLLLTLYSFVLGSLGNQNDNQQFVIQEAVIHQAVIQPNDNFNLTPVREALISNKIIGDVLDDFEPKYYLDVVYPKHETRVMLGTEIKPKYVKDRPRFGIHLVPHSHTETDKKDKATPRSFTLILTDPDATSRYDPKWSEMCHWIVTNLTSTKSASRSGLGDIDGVIEEDESFDTVEWSGIEHTSNEHESVQETSGRPAKADKHKKHHRDRKHVSQKKDKKLPGELESYFAPAPPPKTGWHRYVFVLLEGDSTSLVAPKERKHWGYGEVRRGVRDWARENGLEVVGANFFFAMNKKQ